MSMLSAQCDKLRERAKELRSLAPDPAMPYLVPSTKETMALAMRSAASEMKDAADTIWELRSMVHKERAEADRLREELEAVRTAAYLYGRDDLKAENDKLRQLVETLRDYIAGYTEPCDFCVMQGTCENHPAPPPCKYELDVENAPVLGWIDDILSELGIEMDDAS